MSDAIIVGGVNGAGKSTIFPALQNVTREDWTFEPVHISREHFINPDDIARTHDAGMVRAGRLALESLELHAASDTSFGYETTMSGVTLASRLQSLRDRGYRIYMPYWPALEILIQAV
jgi:predicted ABC-type ATPase